jgi:DNA-binding response OmpR family regulator
LLVEDEVLIAMDVEQLCRDNGAADVIVKSSVEELDGHLDDFDVAIDDLMLSGVSTAPFAHRLVAAGRPFVFASGYTDNEEILRSFPAAQVVEKPYAGNDLVEAVAAAVRR